mmetsp:Transcript_28632/g.51346  ORF Transcript_28632/g.51346 Transcript_28632/m.51346 type:complete len:80 (+) Transcript_28632:831-1070(+)
MGCFTKALAVHRFVFQPQPHNGTILAWAGMGPHQIVQSCPHEDDPQQPPNEGGPGKDRSPQAAPPSLQRSFPTALSEGG